MPINQLWGGAKTELPVFALGGVFRDDGDLEAITDEVQELKAFGIGGLKVKVGKKSPKEDVARVAAAREAAGPEFILAADANQSWSRQDALEFVRIVRDLNLAWIEEPCKWDNDREDLAIVRSIGGLPVAAGQSELSKFGCRDLLTAGSIDYCNFDAYWGGGPTEWRKVAALASAFGVVALQHIEPQIGLMMAAGVENSALAEVFLPWRVPFFLPSHRQHARTPVPRGQVHPAHWRWLREFSSTRTTSPSPAGTPHDFGSGLAGSSERNRAPRPHRWGRRPMGSLLELTRLHLGDVGRPGSRTQRPVSSASLCTRGHGGTASTPGPYDFDLLADDLLALLVAVGVDRCTLVGLSMGGMLAQVAALKQPEAFTGLVLADTTSRYGPEVSAFWANRVAVALTSGLSSIAETTPSRWFTAGFADRNPELVARYQAMVRSTDPEGYAGCCAAIPEIDVTDRLSAITIPTAVIVGADDPSTTVDHADRIHRAIWRSSLHVIPDAARLFNVEQPEAFTAVLLDFLSATAPKGTE